MQTSLRVKNPMMVGWSKKSNDGWSKKSKHLFQELFIVTMAQVFLIKLFKKFKFYVPKRNMPLR